MPSFLDKLLVKTPAYNIFPIHDVHNKLNMPIGRNIPVKYIELHAGEEVDVNLTQLTRFMPMLNPIFHRVNLEFIPFFVPFRLLKDFGFDGENYFNPATPDSERVPMPMIHPRNLYKNITRLHNSIWDYLRYPTMSFLIRQFMNDSNQNYVISDYGSDDGGRNYISVFEQVPGNTIGVHIKAINPSSQATLLSVDVWDFHSYVLRKFAQSLGVDFDNLPPLSPWLVLNSMESVISENPDPIDWDNVFKVTGKRSQEFYEDYLNYLHITFVDSYLDTLPVHDDDKVSLLPWLCYNRLIYDWFVNTGLTDISSVPQYFSNLLYQLSQGDNFCDELDRFDNELAYFFPSPVYDDNDDLVGYNALPACTLWQRDYFTGSFVSAQSGDVVPIPANGTIPDLAGARKLQWFKTLNLFGGKRFIDQIFAHRGVKSSDARLDRCEVIGEKKSFRLQISDVLQTSQSSVDSELGSFSGHGISYAGDHLLHYRAEEPGLVMVIARCRPSLEYMENVPRLLFKSDFYDFENHEFDNVGMQPILSNELEYHPNNDSGRVFSWTRRYAEYMTDISEIHGDFKTTLANWHMARSFNNGRPLFNTRFSVIRANGADDLNRIFSNPQYSNSILMDLTFDIQVSRPLSKVVEFDF